MTQLAVSVILVGKCVLAHSGGRRDEAGVQGASMGVVGGRGQQCSAGDGSMESVDAALDWEAGWIIGRATVQNRQTGR